MARFTLQPQLPLFDPAPEAPRQRVGRKPHVPTPEQMLLANELKASGATWPTIARALGVCVNTVARHYSPIGKANPPKGRRRHKRTPGTREAVRRAIAGGIAKGRIAKLI